MEKENIKIPTEKKIVFKVFGIPVFSKTIITTCEYDETELYSSLSEKLSGDLVESLKRIGIQR